jgi:multicomponent Na+:H+ antiporter subunit B
MTQGLLLLWVISGFIIIFENRTYRLIVYYCFFSLVTSVVYLLLGSPDVAMAEAAITAFSTIFFIICMEKYYSNRDNRAQDRAPGDALIKKFFKILPALVLCVGLFFLVVHFIPQTGASNYLKYEYLARFMDDVGGENAVTAIYLGYRVYDTLFEALILVIAVVAVSHMSYSEQTQAVSEDYSEIKNSRVAILSVRIVCPLIIAFGVYLILNGHITAGGGFQGGVVLATFFICRYMVFSIYDISIDTVIRMEEFFFVGITIITVLVVFIGVSVYVPAAILPFYQNAYLLAMNLLIGLKVASGFFVLFYRYITIERR